jgi:hypothetical protein
MHAVLRNRDGDVEAVCATVEFLARRIGDRPVERIDVWPGMDSRQATSQVGITLVDGSSTIFDLPTIAEYVPWVLGREGRARGWPQPLIHDPARRATDGPTSSSNP